MAKPNPLRNVLVALTVIIAIGSIVTITTFLIQIGIVDIGLTETPNIVPPLAEIPVVGDDPNETNPDNDWQKKQVHQALKLTVVVSVLNFPESL